VTSSLVEFEAAIQLKSTHLIKSSLKTRKKILYINLHLKDRLDTEVKLAKAIWCRRKRWHHLPYL